MKWEGEFTLQFVPLVSTASQGTSNIPFPWFLMLGCNSQAQVFIFLSLAVGTISTKGKGKVNRCQNLTDKLRNPSVSSLKGIING